MCQMSVLCVTYAYPPSCLWGYVSSSPIGTGMGPMPYLTFPLDEIHLKSL